MRAAAVPNPPALQKKVKNLWMSHTIRLKQWFGAEQHTCIENQLIIAKSLHRKFAFVYHLTRTLDTVNSFRLDVWQPGSPRQYTCASFYGKSKQQTYSSAALLSPLLDDHTVLPNNNGYVSGSGRNFVIVGKTIAETIMPYLIGMFYSTDCPDWRNMNSNR